MKISVILLSLSVIIARAASPAAAGPEFNPEDEFFDLERASLQELLDIRTSLASRSAMKLRETPGLVTVITREQIQASGARDLIDVLEQVPELSFGMDVQGNLGLGVRGNWGNEGKVLLLWDGQPYNEPLYSTIQFDRFPIDQVEELEIIKGPGSVLYGGNAELAVINIRTRPPAGLNRGRAYAAYGQGAAARSRTYAGFAWGKADDAAEYSAQAFWGEGQRSDRRYTDFSGVSYNMNRTSDLRPRGVNLYGRRGGTSLRLIADRYQLRDRDHFGDVLTTGSSKVEFPGFFSELRHDLQPTPELSLHPYLSYSDRGSWMEKDEYFTYDKHVRSLSAGLSARYALSSGAEASGGGEFLHEAVSVDSATDPDSRYARGNGRAYDNVAIFGQTTLNWPLGIVTGGVRYEKHSHYGASLVPRIAVTGLTGDLNFKAMYSMAFRAPSIENIRLNPAIEPERTHTQELEAGYKASDTLYLSANVFNTVIKHPIVFTYLAGKEAYGNFSRTGTAGGGLSLKYKEKAVMADLGYSYQESCANRVALYSVAGRQSYMLAFPRHKLTLDSSLPLGNGLSLNPSAFYVSKRYGYGGDGSLRVFGERTIANLNLHARNLAANGLSLSLGVRDLFNSGYRHLQPYDGGHAPLPAPSRELFLKGEYGF
ncbi:MAG: TonB-dependent receptor plug domain-containing protein [Elusimicrobia bacterium]|nr:TonB-dependent receptor plug domain-containing protein [Elusimicrobiota bacterium]